MSFSNHLDAHSRIVPETGQYQDVRTRTPVPVANLLLAALLTLAIVAVLWLAGEQHRTNCLGAGNTGCTVLPWSNGAPARAQRVTYAPEDLDEIRGLIRAAN